MPKTSPVPGPSIELVAREKDGNRWPLERVLFALAGSMTLLSAALAASVSAWFLLLTAVVGLNQWLYVAFGACPASLVLSRLLDPRSAHDPEIPDPHSR